MDTSDETATNLKQGIKSDLITNIAATLFNEKKEKEKRQLNLFLHNINESNNADISKQKEENVSAAAFNTPGLCECASVYQWVFFQLVRNVTQ